MSIPRFPVSPFYIPHGLTVLEKFLNQQLPFKNAVYMMDLVLHLGSCVVVLWPPTFKHGTNDNSLRH